MEPRAFVRVPPYVMTGALVGLALLLAGPFRDAVALRSRYFGQGQALYGLFEVETFVRNGQQVEPLATDAVTWKRIGSDGRYGDRFVNVQFANGDLRNFAVSEDSALRLWSLRPLGGSSVVARFRYDFEADGAITLRGSIGEDSVDLRLGQIEASRFPRVQHQ